MKYIIVFILGILLGWYLCVKVNHIKRTVQHKINQVISETIDEGVGNVSSSLDNAGNRIVDDSFKSVRGKKIVIDTNKVIELSELGGN